MSNKSPSRVVPKQILDLTRLMEFAKANGFPNASSLIWEVNNPEFPAEDLKTLLDDCCGEARVTFGIDLGITPLIARRDTDEDGNDGEDYFANDTPWTSAEGKK